MPERMPVAGAALLALALLAAVGAGLVVDGPALALAWLAQVPAALAIALLRGSRGRRALAADAGRLALLWGGGFLLAGALLAWPLLRLREAPSLGHALALAGLAGALLVALWWRWPDWHTLERSGGSAQSRFAARQAQDPAAWRGLLLGALPVFLLLAGGLLLGWPGLLAGNGRLFAGIAYALLLPLAHLALQSAAPAIALHGLPVVEMDAGPDDAATAGDVLDSEPAIAPLPAADEASSAAELAGLGRQLYAAARLGRVERALALLAAGADPHAPLEPDARDRRSLPVLAAVLPDLRLLRALIERGVDVNAIHDGMTPLLAATRDSWHGRPEAVMTLLANGADPRIADADGNTPLHHAARSSDPGVAALLRDAAAAIDALNGAGLSPLGSACACGNWRLARFLLERGARPEPAGGQPALLAAAGSDEDDPAGVLLLLRHKAKANARDGRGRSALHEAAVAGHAAICQALLEAGAEVDVRDGEGRTPLLEAARCGAHAALEVLLAAGADAGACDAAGANALHLACTAEAPAPALVQLLLAQGVDPHATDAHGRSAVDLAEAAGRWTLAALLDPGRSPAAAPGEDELPPERPPSLLLREALLEDADATRLQGLAARLEREDFDRLLADAEITDSPARTDWLLRQGANPEYRPPGAPTPLRAALLRGEAGMAAARRLLAYGASPAGAGGLADYLAACLETPAADPGGEAFALELLARGADPFAVSSAGEPPLLLAVRLDWQALLLQLLAHGADPDACDGRGMSPLHYAASLGRPQMLTALLAAGAAPDRRAADGQTPLGIALASGRRDLADWLDWRGWPLPHRPLRVTDLPAAAITGDRDAVRRLLDLGFPVDTTDSQGCTALLRAAGGGHLGLVEDLLARGADPGRTANTGATALSAAVSMRQPEIVERLLQAGCSLEQRLPGEVTVLMLAAALGLPELVARLLRAGADLHAVDAQGQTPLHCAALYGFTARDRARLLALLDGLLLAGADPHLAARNGTTPLLLLLGARAEPGTPSSEDVLLAALDRLLDEDVRLDACDARGYGPLHLAALHGLRRTVQALLRAGGDPAQADAGGRTPRDVALMRGYVDIAAELVPPVAPPPSGVSMARFLRE